MGAAAAARGPTCGVPKSSLARGPRPLRRRAPWHAEREGVRRSRPAQALAGKGAGAGGRRPVGREVGAALHLTQIWGPLAGVPACLGAGPAVGKRQGCGPAAEQPWSERSLRCGTPIFRAANAVFCLPSLPLPLPQSVLPGWPGDGAFTLHAVVSTACQLMAAGGMAIS